ncbi:MAG: HAD hydrolase-like protein [Candidatus Nomurabacteria bacterium]|nr:HAD hydrolase-like protein [Candidatus Nomurabacteria bacterium]
MTKAILFDLDGLIITGSGKLFSERLSEKENIPMKQISEFFTNEFRECSFGKADLKEKITPYLTKWNYKGNSDDLLKFWFEGESNVNKEVLKIVEDLRSKNVKCYIATRQEKNRKDYVWNELNLKNNFDGIFCTCDIGYDKWQAEYWGYILNELKLKPEEIMFFCDSQKNVDSGNGFGIEAYYYEGLSFLKEKIKRFFCC